MLRWNMSVHNNGKLENNSDVSVFVSYNVNLSIAKNDDKLPLLQ